MKTRLLITTIAVALAWLVLPAEVRFYSLMLFGTLVVPNASEVFLLEAGVGKTNMTALTLRLYTVISPALGNGTVVAHLTEAAGGGYAAKSLTAASWTASPGSPSELAYPLQTFTFTGPLTTNPGVLGYYVTKADGALVWAEPLAATFTPVNNGDTLDVTPKFTGASTVSD